MIEAGSPREAVIVEAVRTPVGRRKGALKDWHASALFARVLSDVVERAGVAACEVDDVLGGCATQVGDQGGNVTRTSLLAAGYPVTVPGTTIQRACGSSQQAIHFASNLIESGDCDVVVAGGVEVMSRSQGAADDPKYGRRYPPELVEKFSMPTMGIAAERIAKRWNLGRAELDALSLRSHQLAARAQEEGRFASQLVPLTLGDGASFAADEGIRRDTSLEKLSTLKPAFEQDGRVTAGNSSQLSDGAAAVLLMSRARAKALGVKPRARFVSRLVVGVEPEIMLSGPIPATRRILERAGLSMKDIDLFEINEAFASVLAAWVHELEPDMDKVNVNGGSIAMGHPLGSTGARLMTMLLNELERRSGRYGLLSMCCGGGMGTATIIERLDA